jgi:hypothetical protein
MVGMVGMLEEEEGGTFSMFLSCELVSSASPVCMVSLFGRKGRKEGVGRKVSEGREEKMTEGRCRKEGREEGPE